MSGPGTLSARSEPERARWNRRYASADRHATPVPNQFLVAEASGMAPGRALDLACGAGRNAVWLAERGWRVTAVDFSDVGLRLSRELGRSRGVKVDWIEADVVEWAPASSAYDLVCVLYLQMPASERRRVLRHAVDAVAPGGTLLVVGHDLSNLAEGWGGPPQAEVLYTPEDIVAEIAGLEVEKAQRVRRSIEEGGALHEAIDTLVRARRPGSAPPGA